MSSGTSLSGFSSFAEATGPLYITGPRDIVNEAQNQTFSFGHLTMGDRGKKKMVQGGANIRESIVFESSGATRFHKPGQTQNWINPQKLQKVQYHWRFVISHMSWVRQEIMLNDRIKFGTADAVFHQYVDLLYKKEMLMWTDKWNFMDDALWAEPNAAEMEDESGTFAMSIPAFVNEDTNGLFNPQDDTAFTTIGGINPAAAGFTKFVPVQNTYTSATINDQGNIIGAFDVTWKDVRFEMPPTYTEYFSNPAYNKQCIWASRVGQTAYQQLIREHSTEGFHNIAGAQDPAIPDPQYLGIPIKWSAPLDTAKLYTTGSATDTEGAASTTTAGPRYYWINSEFLYPVFHDEMYFEKDEVTRDHNDPDTYVMPVSTWYNVICTSRQRQAIVSPGTDALYDTLY